VALNSIGDRSVPPTGPAVDTGLLGLVMLARFHGVAADPEQLKHQFGVTGRPFGSGEIQRAARALGLKVREVASTIDRLQATPLPALVAMKDGSFWIAGAIAEDKVLGQTPGDTKPEILTPQEFQERWSGQAILLARRSLLPGMSGRFDLSWFIPSLVKYRKLLSEVLLASFFIQILALVTPLFFQVVIDKVLVHNGLTTLSVLAIGLLVVSVFEVVLGGLRAYLFSHTASRVDVELGAKLYQHLQGLPIAFFLARPVGTIVARVRELESLRNFITSTTLTVAIDLVFTIVFLIVMFLYSPTLFWVVAATVPAYVALSVVVTPILRRRLNEKFQRGAENQAFLVESVSAAETVKAMAIEPQMQRRWEEQLAGYVASSFRATNLGNVANQIASFTSKVTTVLILWIGARLVIDNQLSVGELIAFNMFAGRVSGPILRLVQLWQEFQQAQISIEKLGDILNTPTESGLAQGRTSLSEVAGQVSFERVTFRYGPQLPEALKNVSLETRVGEVIGLVGRSGSGKSTLTRLIQRMYTPESGRVRIDGVDLAMIDPTWLRRQIGVVLQENVLLNRSVRDNIALADPGLPMEPIVHAAKMAGAHEFILELPQGYDTIIQEHGSNLSGGQRQRIAIARALVTNPRILIFDEATSALDYESERIIQENMRLICNGRTVFIIAHRLSAVRHANRILMLDRGEIVEEGSHEELLARRGHYAALHSLQAA
jgi:ATP-binding cassette, subfamily B, bacterial HlyB/CyaB